MHKNVQNFLSENAHVSIILSRFSYIETAISRMLKTKTVCTKQSDDQYSKILLWYIQK